MAKPKVVILGATGMLGSMVLDLFAKSGEFNIIATYRNHKIGRLLKDQYPKVDFRKLDAEKISLKSLVDTIKGVQWLVNALGITKPYIHDDNAGEIEQAVCVNAHFSHLLTQAAKKTGTKIIQIATDCVYSGQKGRYIETDSHDALDVYGKTKSLGEVFGENIYHLRCSIIGRELKGHNSLLDWFLHQPQKAQVNGFKNHRWNGLTALHFARICHGIIKKGIKLPHIQHIIPTNSMSKANLLKRIAKEFKREDIVIKNMKAHTVINRTLSTANEKLNQELWQLAGYSSPPSIQKMVKELSKYKFWGGLKK